MVFALPSMARSVGFSRLIGFCSSKESSARSVGVCSPKNSSNGFRPPMNSSLARPNGFRPPMISSLARLIGFRPSMNSSSLILCHSRTNGGSTTFATATHTEEIARRSVQLPWLMLQPPESTSVYKFYRMFKNDVKVVAVESTQDPSDSYSQFLGSPFLGWMAYIRRKDCQFFLFNPLSGKKIILPPIETLPFIKSFVRNRLSGSVESYTTNYTARGRPISPQIFSESIIKDVVLSSSPMDDDCIAVIIYGCPAELAFCRIRHGHPNSCWILLDSPFKQCYQIVYHSEKKLFYTLSSITDELEAWDLHNDPIKRFHFHEVHEDPTGVLGSRRFPLKKVGRFKRSIVPIYWENKSYLVYDHQSQELFLVIHFVLTSLVQDVHCVPHIHPDSLPYKTLGFDVFKFDFINDHHLVKLQLLEDIGDRAIFLDERRAFALSTTQFPELRSGSIYFADGRYKWKYNFGGHDMGICNYANDRVIDQIPFPSHTWFIPDVDVDF
ncbi:hypothetical protein T459_18116 [Capsicum annuum]|uniref:KIB1-4 beta-propeller domain-containing protein n=1 Tax=Capsicum annuum TaxID=4072 RepID=A0A2G2ZDP3_CAPAN|nr:hypothetical protein T459_18116 [Capsicum annuum]